MEKNISVRKLQLMIVNDDKEKRNEQYSFIRNSQYAQYQALNNCMGFLMAGYHLYRRDIKSDGFKQHQKKITNSMEAFDNIAFGSGIDTKSAVTQKVKKDFSAALKNGLAKGERSCPTYKRTFPLMTRGRDLKFFEETVIGSDGNEYCEFRIKWVNKITFKVVLSKKNNKNYPELVHMMRKIINAEYKINQSSMEFVNDKLILNLNYEFEKIKTKEPIPGNVVGVTLGVNSPVVCSLVNTLEGKTKQEKIIGDVNDLLRVKKQFEARRNRLQKNLTMNPGGNGRKNKMKAFNDFKDKEMRYVKTYKHTLTKKIIEFAKKNKAETIKLELLLNDLKNEGRLVSDVKYFAYHLFKEMLHYKAERENIKILYVDPSSINKTTDINTANSIAHSEKIVTSKNDCVTKEV